MSSINSRTPPLRLAAVDSPSDGEVAAYQASSGQFEWVANGSGGGGTVTSVGLTETGSALTITGSPITGSGTINIAGAGTSSQVILGDLTLGTLTSGTVTSVSSSQAFITITDPTTTASISIGNASASATGVLTSTDWNTFNNKGDGTVTSVTASSPLSSTGGATPAISITQSNATTDGYLSSTDWNTFNDKQDALTLTTTGSSGAASLVGSTLNIPEYSGGGTIGGSIASTQVARGATTANEIEGDNGLLFDGTSFTINTLSTSDPVLNMSSSTKSIALEVNTSQKLSVKGGSNSFIFDASSATGGITWPDGSEQVSAATLTSITGTSPISVSAGTTPVISLDDSGVTQGIYTNASITVDAKGLVTSASSGNTPGTVNGTGANGQVAFWIDTDEIDGSIGLTFDSTTGNLTVGGYVSSGDGKVTTPSGTNLELIPGGASSGSIIIADGADGQISLNPNGTGTVKIDGVEIDNSAIATGYVLKATSATAAGWAAESGGGGGAPTNAEYVTLATDASLTNERVLANGQGIGYIDGGAGNNVTVQSRVFNAPRSKEAGDRWVVTKMPPYSQGVTARSLSSTSTSYDRPSFYTFIAPASGEIDELGIFVSGPASSTCNALLGVYTTSTDGWPDELMGYATFDVTSNGQKNSSSFTYVNGYTAIRTNAGETYWLGFVRDTTLIQFTVYSVHVTDSPQMFSFVGSSSSIISSAGFQYTASDLALPPLPNQTNWIGASTEVYAHASISYAV